MRRRIAVLTSVLKIVNTASTELRHDFWLAHQKLEEAQDLRSWDELATLPAKDPETLPKDSWIMPLGDGGWITYVITEGDAVKDAEIVGAELPPDQV